MHGWQARCPSIPPRIPPIRPTDRNSITSHIVDSWTTARCPPVGCRWVRPELDQPASRPHPVVRMWPWRWPVRSPFTPRSRCWWFSCRSGCCRRRLPSRLRLQWSSNRPHRWRLPRHLRLCRRRPPRRRSCSPSRQPNHRNRPKPFRRPSRRPRRRFSRSRHPRRNRSRRQFRLRLLRLRRYLRHRPRRGRRLGRHPANRLGRDRPAPAPPLLCRHSRPRPRKRPRRQRRPLRPVRPWARSAATGAARSSRGCRPTIRIPMRPGAAATRAAQSCASP